MAMPLWLKEKLFQKSLLIDLLRAEAPDVDWEKKLRFTEHHESHAASAFYPSPFDEAAILTMDGVGEWATTSMGVGSGNTLRGSFRRLLYPRRYLRPQTHCLSKDWPTHAVANTVSWRLMLAASGAARRISKFTGGSCRRRKEAGGSASGGMGSFTR